MNRNERLDRLLRELFQRGHLREPPVGLTGDSDKDEFERVFSEVARRARASRATAELGCWSGLRLHVVRTVDDAPLSPGPGWVWVPVVTGYTGPDGLDRTPTAWAVAPVFGSDDVIIRVADDERAPVLCHGDYVLVSRVAVPVARWVATVGPSGGVSYCSRAESRGIVRVLGRIAAFWPSPDQPPPPPS